MRVVGLSGGIACGKSTVTASLRQKGFVVLDCDVIARDVVRKGRWGWKRVVSSFGPSFLDTRGELDRERLGALVFNDPSARKRLNAATHLPVMVELARQVAWAWLSCTWVVVIDMPLLFETGSYKWTSPNVVVVCSEEVQMSRLMARNALSAEAAAARMAAQMPLSQKGRLADVVLHNDGSLAALEEQVLRLCGLMTQGSHVWGPLTSPWAVAGGLAAAAYAVMRVLA